MTAVEEVLSLLQDTGVTLKLKKCAFFKIKVYYLGQTILPGKLEAASGPTREISGAPFPTDITRILSLLGAFNGYIRFVPGFAAVGQSLNAMFNKDGEIDWGAPTKHQLEAFQELKKNLVNPLILSLPKRGAPYMVDTDARQYALESVLFQEQKVQGDVSGQKEKTWVTIGYC